MKTLLFSFLILNGLFFINHNINETNTTATDKPISTATSLAIHSVIPENAPKQYREAYHIAEDFVTFAPISKDTLYHILISEGQTLGTASYVADTVIVDWNEMALQKAYNILQVSGRSEKDMRDELIFNGFQKGEIDYAIKKIY